MTITGLIGFPTAHSLSPRIHQYWAAQHKIVTDYKCFTTPPNRLRQTMLHMRKKNWRGVNITVPHKQAVLEYLDQIDATATRIGAVNTVTNESGVLRGSNTDAYGFISNLRAGLGDLTPYLENIVILGAGGATRAVIAALQEEGAKHIALANRTYAASQQLSQEFVVSCVEWEARETLLPQASLLINTTSLGMENHPPLTLDLSAIAPRAAVHDIVYAPLETELLRAAKARGNPTVDGLGMLLYQAQKAFETWHGISPEVTPELRAHVLENQP